MSLMIPERLAIMCRKTPERQAWLEQLLIVIEQLKVTWSLVLGAPYDNNEGSCAWVAPALCSDGTRAVLKLGMPHMEGTHEIAALRFWNGAPTVRLLAAHDELNAMLLERCEPGTWLRQLPEPDQDVVVAGLLRRLWLAPAAPHPFRALATMTAHWAAATRGCCPMARCWVGPRRSQPVRGAAADSATQCIAGDRSARGQHPPGATGAMACY